MFASAGVFHFEDYGKVAAAKKRLAVGLPHRAQVVQGGQGIGGTLNGRNVVRNGGVHDFSEQWRTNSLAAGKLVVQ